MKEREENLQFELIDNILRAEDLINLWVQVGFLDDSTKYPVEQAQKAINNGLFTVTAICDEKVVGMGRLVGDGVMYWYLQEVCVDPEYQGKGIGKSIVNRLIAHVKQSGLPGTKVTIGLMAAKGKESFYEKLGFSVRPNDNAGAGMVQRVIINESK